MTRDEIYIPSVRSERKLPKEEDAQPHHYAEAFDDAPIVTAAKFLTMQLMYFISFLNRLQSSTDALF
jgi:hypothetical protein